MKGQIEKVYSKQCRFCSSKEQPVQIFWNDIKKHFADGPNSDSPKHACSASSTKQRQEDFDQKFNQTINDLKSQAANQHNDQVQRIDALQRSQAHQTSLLVEIKAKIDGALRGYG